jgi:hypothetical protein
MACVGHPVHAGVARKAGYACGGDDLAAECLWSLWGSPEVRAYLATARRTAVASTERHALLLHPTRLDRSGTGVRVVRVALAQESIIKQLGQAEFLTAFFSYDRATELPVLAANGLPSGDSCFEFNWVVLRWPPGGCVGSPLRTRFCRPCAPADVAEHLGALKRRWAGVGRVEVCGVVGGESGCRAFACPLPADHPSVGCGCDGAPHRYCSTSCRDADVVRHTACESRAGLLSDRETGELAAHLAALPPASVAALSVGTRTDARAHRNRVKRRRRRQARASPPGGPLLPGAW